jgi:predicted DNA-binding protein (UPF0278 family)
MTLQEILNTDCYVQFDTNEELREFIERNGLEVDEIYNHELYIRFHKILLPYSLSLPQHPELIYYHHTTITT